MISMSYCNHILFTKTFLIGGSSSKHYKHCEILLIQGPAELPLHHSSRLTAACRQKENCLCGSIQHNGTVCARLGVSLIPPEKWVRETVSVMCWWAMQPCDIACLTHRWAGSLFLSTAPCKLSRAPLARGLLHRTASKSLCLSVCVCRNSWCQGCLPNTLREGLGLCGPQWFVLYASIAPICCDVRHIRHKCKWEQLQRGFDLMIQFESF